MIFYCVHKSLFLCINITTAMRTNIEIDDALMKEAMQALGVRTKKEAVEIGLKLAKERAARQDMQKMRGQVDFWPGYKKEIYGR